MSFFQELSDKLFPKKTEPKAQKEPVIREELKRSKQGLEQYESWLQSEQKEQIVSFIDNQFNESRDENENVSLFRVIHSGSTNGFMLRFLAETDPLHFQHLFDFLKDQVKTLQYLPYTSDVRTFDRENFVERIERHYLKPSWRTLNTKEVNDSGKMNQLYGNITVELVYQNDIPQFIKFVCHHYSDSKFSEPKPFTELVRLITR